MKKKLIATLLATIITTGYIPQQVFANSLEYVQAIQNNIKYVNGTYTVKNEILKLDKDEESVARSYVSENTVIDITNQGISVTLRLTRADIMSNTQIKVNGTSVNYTETKISEKETDIKFSLSSFEDNIEVSTTVNMGFSMNVAFRATIDSTDIPVVSEEEQKTGLYTIENDTLQINNDKESVARKYLNKVSEVEYENGKTYLTLKFTGKSMMTNHVVKVNGVETAFEVVNDADDNLDIKFEISTLSDGIVVATRVLGVMDVEFRVVLNEDTLTRIDSVDPTPNPEPTPDPEPVPPTEEPTPEVKPEPTPPTTDNEIKESHEVYKVQNEILTDSAIGYQAARNAISTTSYYEIIDGVKYITLGFSQLDLMSNIRVAVNGSIVQYEVLRQSSNTMDIRFNVSDITSQPTITAYVEAIGRDISFGVDFLENTLVLVSKSEIETPLGSTGGTTGGNSNSGNTSENTNGTNSEEDVDGDIEVNEYYKRYSIENNVVSSSETGREMARKYVDKISILEEIDGKLYLTVSFSGTNLMNNIRVTVNGSEVSHSVIASDDNNNTKSIRLEISDINDDIRIYMHVIPVSMDISFGFELLEDSMKLLEEGEVVEVKTSNNEEVEDNELLAGSSEIEEDLSENTAKIVVATATATLLLVALIQGAVYAIIRKKRKVTSENQ